MNNTTEGQTMMFYIYSEKAGADSYGRHILAAQSLTEAIAKVESGDWPEQILDIYDENDIELAVNVEVT